MLQIKISVIFLFSFFPLCNVFILLRRLLFSHLPEPQYLLRNGESGISDTAPLIVRLRESQRVGNVCSWPLISCSFGNCWISLATNHLNLHMQLLKWFLLCCSVSVVVLSIDCPWTCLLTFFCVCISFYPLPSLDSKSSSPSGVI